MKVLQLFCAVLLLHHGAYAQTENELAYKAWLDSMQNPNYIMENTLVLDDLYFVHTKENDQFGLVNFNKNNLADTDKTLSCIPGIALIKRGNFGSEPMLRGMGSERYTVTIDGMRLFGACTDKMDPPSSYIEPNNLSTLNYSLGSEDVLNSSGTGGCVNFGLKSPVFNAQDRFSGRAGLKYNSNFNGFDQLLDANVSLAKYALRGSFVHRKAQNYHIGGGEEVPYSQFEKLNYSLSISRLIQGNSLLTLSFLGDDGLNIGYPALAMDVGYAKAKLFGIGYYKAQWGIFKEVETKIYYNAVDHAMDDTKRANVAMHMDMPGSSKTTGAFIKAELPGGIKAKAEYYNNFSKAEMTMYPEGEAPMYLQTWPEVNRQHVGVALDKVTKIAEEINLQTGVRTEWVGSQIGSAIGQQQLSIFQASGGHNAHVLLNANTKVNIQASTKTKLSYRLSYGERMPTISEQYGYFLFNVLDGYDYLGAPGINKEKVVQNELGWQYQHNHIRWEMNIFHYAFWDYILGASNGAIDPITPAASGVKVYSNIDRASSMGGELSIMANLSKKSHVMLSGTYVVGKDHLFHPLPQIPPLKINAQLQQRVKRFLIVPEVNYSHAQLKVSAQFKEQSTAGYVLFNLGVHHSVPIKNGSIDLVAGVENIADTKYRAHSDLGNIMRVGRNFYLNFIWNFKSIRP